MELLEGLSIFHIIAAVLGIILFVTSLVLFIRSAVKTNTYPKPLIACFIIGGMLEVFPITGKFEAGSILKDIGTLSMEVKKDPANTKKKEQLLQKMKVAEDWNYKTEASKLKIMKAKKVLNYKP